MNTNGYGKEEPKFRWDPTLDQELWRVIGLNWSIPFYLRYCFADDEPFAQMVPAVPLSIEQADILTVRISAVRSIKLSSGWAVDRVDVPKIAKRCTGLTPSFWYRWPGMKGRPEVRLPDLVVRGGMTETDEEFIAEVAKNTRIADPDKLLLVWVAMCNTMSKWLLAGKPLRFGGLFTVRALPLRRNWLDLILSRVPGLRKVYLSKSAAQLLSLFFTGANRWLRCPDMMETKSGRLASSATIYRQNLFVSNGAIWTTAMDAHEGRILAQIGAQAYLRRWANIIRRNENEIHRLGLAAVTEANRPSARMAEGSRDDGPRLVSKIPKPIRHATVVERLGGQPESVDDFAIVDDAVAETNEASARLLALPHAAPPVMDLRASG